MVMGRLFLPVFPAFFVRKWQWRPCRPLPSRGPPFAARRKIPYGGPAIKRKTGRNLPPCQKIVINESLNKNPSERE